MTTHKQRGFFMTFAIRWLVSALGLWIAAGFFSSGISYDNKIRVIIISGAILALFNMIIKPLLVVISMPALLLSLGLFMLILNGAIVYAVSKIYAPPEITNFWVAVLTGLVIGFVNYLVTAILEES